MSTLRDGIRMPAPGRAPGPSFHREQIEGAQRGQLITMPGFRIDRGVGGTRLRPKAAPVAAVAARPLALAQYSSGLVVTLTAGYLIMRGALIPVAQQTVTLSNGPNVLWLQFAIAPSVTPTPLLQKASAYPTGGDIDLVNYGYWPLSQWSASTSTGIATLSALHHPGGNIPYPVS